MNKKKILCFFGTRPEAIKMAPVVEALQKSKSLQPIVALSAQHRQMLDQVMKLFKLKSHIDLNLMKDGQSLTDITTGVIKHFEPALEKWKPDMVLVHGDTTTTLGGALASYYKKIPVGHVEAGLRTDDIYRPFPEEMNRRITDSIATLFFPPTPESKKNLLKQNLDPKNIFITGNTVIDALLETAHKNLKFESGFLKKCIPQLQKNKNKIILMTAHRRENFGAPFEDVCRAVHQLSILFPEVHWIYPVHPNPNVLKPAHAFLGKRPNIHLMNPLGYGDLVQVMKVSSIVVTDSGGLQEEAPSLGKPVLVLRDVTERPEAVSAGTVQLVGTDPKKIIDGVSKLLTKNDFYKKMANAVNPYGDGLASKRIVEAIEWYFGLRKKPPTPFKPK